MLLSFHAVHHGLGPVLMSFQVQLCFYNECSLNMNYMLNETLHVSSEYEEKKGLSRVQTLQISQMHQASSERSLCRLQSAFHLTGRNTPKSSAS